MKSFSVLVGVLLVGVFVRSAGAANPNIVIILADDLGYGDAHCFNPERGKIATPAIDRLAAEGMRFTDGHSSSGVCSPTRYSLLTGRYHWRSRLQSGIVGLWERPLIAEDRLTIAGLLKAQGYRTAAIGKWHLGWDWSEVKGQKAEGEFDWSKRILGGPTTRGFDSYFGTDVPNWPPFCFIENDRSVGVPSRKLAQSDFENNRASKQGPALPGWKLEEILPTLEQRACAFIADATKRPEPFFLYLPLTAPHTPIAVAEAWKGKSGLIPYADFVMQTDATVGRVLEALEKSGAASNTLVIFTSDNGCAPYIGVKDMEAKGHFPSGPLRGYKGSAWEGGHRIPFIARWPGVTAAGSRCDELVMQADFMATFAEITGAKIPDGAGEDSFSLLPLLKGGNQPVREFAINQAMNGLMALRQGSWKYIAGGMAGGFSKEDVGAQAQLYNLADDLGEQKNLLTAEPERAAAMQATLAKLVTAGSSRPGARSANDVEVKWDRFLNAPPAAKKPGAKAKK